MKTYNFIDAVNSGKRFKIHNQETYFKDIKDVFSEGNVFGNNCLLEFINTKFVLEEKTITITESEFEAAYLSYGNCFKNFREELGF